MAIISAYTQFFQNDWPKVVPILAAVLLNLEWIPVYNSLNMKRNSRSLKVNKNESFQIFS